ncbi:MAG: hypothetical protein ACI9FJ_000917 [Alteromonadaceae bacterium]|jgi:hypothetical protein
MKNLQASLLLILSATAGISGCSSHTTQTNTSPATTQAVDSQVVNPQFARFTEQFIEDLWREMPVWAMWSGYHKYDHILVIPNEASRKQRLAFIVKQRAALAQQPFEQLNDGQKIDYHLIENLLDTEQWLELEEKGDQWNPSHYNIAGSFAKIINGNYDTLDNRLVTFLKRAEQVPQYYQAAKANITIPTIEHTELAILRNNGGLIVFDDELLKKVADSGLSAAQKALFKQRVAAAKAAISDYVDFLEQRLVQLKADGNARSFRLGETLYEQKFAISIQSQYTAKQIYQKALGDMQAVNQKMTVITHQLWPKYFADIAKPAKNSEATAQLIKHLSVNHVKRENFIDEIRRQIPTLEAFIKQKDLVTLDPEKPLVVRETPLYMRGLAGASISAPGPYDNKANTYYNVTPLDNMSEEQGESYLREYNQWVLQILNIHEAIPGHYTQKMYANKSPSLLKTILSNGAMTEGWAVYSERMMLEEGYGDFEPELWLMYYKWNLRVIANTVLDYGVHVDGMTKVQALDLLMNKAFQEKAEAQGKWRRVTLSQVQLTSYYSGYREIYDFREEMKAKAGNDFNLKAFHEAFLSYGNAPVKYIKQLMRK